MRPYRHRTGPGLRVLRGAALLATALLLLAGRPALAGDSLSIVLSSKTPALMNALNLIAKGGGFYKDEGLTISNLYVEGALEAMRTCQSGKGDICPIGVEPMVANYGDGVPLKLFFSRSRKFAYVIAVPQDSPVETLADLKGRKIGVHVISAAASGVFTTQSALSAVGIKPDDYSFLAIGYEDQAAAALASGEVAAAAFPYYELIPLMVGGKRFRIFHHPRFENVPNVGYAAAPSVLTGKRDAVRRFSRAIVKASLLVRYNPGAAARLLLQADGKPFTDEDLRRRTAELTAWESYLPAADPKSRRIGAFSAEGMQNYIQLLTEAGVTKARVPAGDLVTNDFIGFANRFDRGSFKTMAASMR